MYTLKVRQHFDAAHHLEGYDGQCSRVHGHRWIVELEVAYDSLSASGMGADFSEVKRVLRNILPDHCDVNEVYVHMNPTAENLARVLYDQAKARIPETVAVTVWETPDCGCRYDGGPDSADEQAKAALESL
jgi:6-pyruvoyltetrahydropterin/6-carboxytetrahydropterin synthase